MNIEKVVASKAVGGEGPFWDARSNALFWLDIAAQKLHRYNPYIGNDEEFLLSKHVSCIVPYGDEDYAVAVSDGVAPLRLDGDAVMIDDIIVSYQQPGIVSNDGRCDRRGRFVVGLMHPEYLRDKGGLYLCNTDLTFQPVQVPMTLPNGIDWSPDETKFYVVESRCLEGECNISEYTYDGENGIFGIRKAFSNVPGADGLCVDEEGNVWVAGCGTGCVVCIEPQKGKIIKRVSLPTQQITSCIFGGEHLDMLFVTSATWGKNEIIRHDPEAGSLFCVTGLGVKGKKANLFLQSKKRKGNVYAGDDN